MWLKERGRLFDQMSRGLDIKILMETEPVQDLVSWHRSRLTPEARVRAYLFLEKRGFGPNICQLALGDELPQLLAVLKL